MPSAAAFIDELQQASCQSCFADMLDEKAFKHYRILYQPDADNYVSLYAASYRNNHTTLKSLSDREYDVIVTQMDEAALADSLLDKFAELDSFYHTLREAQQQIDANMPVEGVRREVFAAQQEKYTELYQHTRAVIDTVLADLRTLLGEHGREYPAEVLANVDNLEARLRQLAQARDAWHNSIEAAVTDKVTPRMQELQARGWEMYKKEKELAEEAQEARNLQAEIVNGLYGIDTPSPTGNSYTQYESSNIHNNWYEQQRKQQEEQDRLNEMAALVALDPFDIF